MKAEIKLEEGWKKIGGRKNVGRTLEERWKKVGDRKKVGRGSEEDRRLEEGWREDGRGLNGDVGELANIYI
jgi:hypothetical protein